MKFMRNGLLVLTLLSLCVEMLPRAHGGGGHRSGGGGHRSSGRSWSGRGHSRGYGHHGYHRGYHRGGFRGAWWGPSYWWLAPTTFSLYNTWTISELNQRISDLEDAVRQSNADNRANYERALDELREERSRRS